MLHQANRSAGRPLEPSPHAPPEIHEQPRRALTAASTNALIQETKVATAWSRATALVTRVVVAVVVGSAGLVIGPAPTAHAASYTVWACANGSGAPLDVGSWTRNVDATLADAQATCGEPSAPAGAMLASARATSGARAGGAGWVLATAKGTRITALDVWWSWQVPPASAGGAIRVYALGNPFVDPTGAVDPFDGKGRCCTDSAFVNLKVGAFGMPTTSNPAAGLADINHQSFPKLRTLDGAGTPIVGLSAACVTGCTSNELVALFQAYRVKAVIGDPTPPTGKADGLRDGLRVGLASPIDATASDTGGGVRELTLRVDGNVVQTVPGGGDCHDVDPSNSDPLEYNLAQPCPSTLAGRLVLNAAQMPDSASHDVTAVATDAAGQNKILSSARVALAAPHGFYDPKNGFYNPDLNVADARKLNSPHADPNAKLTLAFERGHRSVRSRTVRYSTAARIRGSVKTRRKKPVAGARVWLATRTSAGDWQISGKPLTTSRKGTVSTRLPARMPSRDVRVLYFPYSDRNDVRTSPRRDLRVQATTTIQSDQGGYRNGDTLVFTGRVIKKGLIANKSVYLQAIVRGKWRTFETTQADSKGRWQMTHLFEATRRPTRYTFRAVVPSQTGYAWATGHSRSVRVLVTP